MSGRQLFWLSALVPAAVALGIVALSVFGLRSYGAALFVGAPLVQGLSSGWLVARLARGSLRAALGAAALGITFMAAGIIALALDGLVCVLMSLPLAYPLALAGALAGHALGRVRDGKTSAGTGLMAMTALPFALLLEARPDRPPPPLHAVTTSVEIRAPAARVWKNVIAFDEIASAPAGLFRMGVAYPIGATIQGTGTGAVRYCRFSTGDFVEPIRVWDEPHRLAFDVVAQPEPMREITFYHGLKAPHLKGTFASEKGQFLLEARGATTVLSGTTWYRQHIQPDWYWHRLSDAIIHRIHQRVLTHIQAQTESGA